MQPSKNPKLLELIVADLHRLGVKAPVFEVKHGSAVNPVRRAKKAMRAHFGLKSGRSWKRFRRRQLRLLSEGSQG